MKLIIKEAAISNLEEIQELFVQTIEHTCSKDYSKEQIRVWTSSVENKERWRKILNSQYFLIALSNNKIVGFGSLKNGNYLDFLYVHKDYLRRGIADKLFGILQKESARLGFNILASDVSITARSFFERKGFIVIKKNKLMRQGIEIENYFMSQ